MTDKVDKQGQMDVQMNAPQRDDVMSGRADGALADDERTEAERSPVAKMRRVTPLDSDSIPDESSSVVEDGSDKREAEGDGQKMDNNQGGVHGNGHKGKRRNRRKGKGGKHHCKKWKPYTKLSWEEKRIQDEKESRRATQRREQRFASGQPMAPYNTTQFLMEQHGEDQELKMEGSNNNNNPEGGIVHHSHPEQSGGGPTVGRTAPLHSISISGEGSGSVDSSEEYYSSPDDEEMFLQRDFSEEYDNFHAERLQAMSKDELVREFLELEGKVEKLENRSDGKVAGGGSVAKNLPSGNKVADCSVINASSPV